MPKVISCSVFRYKKMMTISSQTHYFAQSIIQFSHYQPINFFHMHIGTRIRKQLNERHQTVVWLARQLACSRTNVYKIFVLFFLDTALLMRISIILNYDFFKLYSDQFQKGECEGFIMKAFTCFLIENQFKTHRM